MKFIAIFCFCIVYTTANDLWPWNWKSYCPQKAKCKCLITSAELKLRLDAVSNLGSQVNDTFQQMLFASESDSQIQFRNLLERIWQQYGFSNRCLIVAKLPCDAAQMIDDTFMKRHQNQIDVINCKKNSNGGISNRVVGQKTQGD